MADQKTSDAAISDAVKIYYNKRLVERLEPKTYLYQLGKKEPIPGNEGNQVEFTGYRSIKPILSNSNELASTQTYISAYKINATLVQRHNYVQLSTLLKQTAIDPNVSGATDVLADQGAKTVEMYLRQTVVGKIGTAARSSITTHSINTTAAQHNTQGVITGTSAQRTHQFWSDFPLLHNKVRLATSADVATINAVGGSAMTVSQVRHGVSYLRSNDVESPAGDDTYPLVVHTWTADAIMQDPTWKTWNNNTNTNTTMYRGEIGQVFGARVIVSNMAFRYEYSAAPLTTASGAFNASFLVGKDCFGVSELAPAMGNQRGFSVIVKTPGPGSTNDPVDLINTVGMKMVMTAAVLNKSAGAIICTTDRVTSSGT